MTTIDLIVLGTIKNQTLNAAIFNGNLCRIGSETGCRQ